MKTTPEHKTEQVGRQYTKQLFEVHSRRVNGDGAWYGASKYKTLAEAQKSIEDVSKPVDIGGGFTIGFATEGREAFEYRIVKVISQCEVVHVENRMV